MMLSQEASPTRPASPLVATPTISSSSPPRQETLRSSRATFDSDADRNHTNDLASATASVTTATTNQYFAHHRHRAKAQGEAGKLGTAGGPEQASSAALVQETPRTPTPTPRLHGAQRSSFLPDDRGGPTNPGWPSPDAFRPTHLTPCTTSPHETTH